MAQYINHNDSSKDDNGTDWLDNMCGGATDAICPLPNQEVIAQVDAVEPKPEEKDLLDHVFTGVESVSCAPPDAKASGSEDNSSVVLPTSSETSSKAQTASAPTAAAAADNRGILMQEGDALDRMFEKVESFVCSAEADTTDDACSIVGDEEQRSVVIMVSDGKGDYRPDVESGGKGDYRPDVESGGTSTSVETELDQEKLDEEKQLWYKNPHFIMVFCMVIAVLLLVVALFLAPWKD
jgi:hypothetical protein